MTIQRKTQTLRRCLESVLNIKTRNISPIERRSIYLHEDEIITARKLKRAQEYDELALHQAMRAHLLTEMQPEEEFAVVIPPRLRSKALHLAVNLYFTTRDYHALSPRWRSNRKDYGHNTKNKRVRVIVSPIAKKEFYIVVSQYKLPSKKVQNHPLKCSTK